MDIQPASISHDDIECLMKAPMCFWRLTTVHPVIAVDESNVSDL